MDYKEAWGQLKAVVESDLKQAQVDESYCINMAPAEFFQGTLDAMTAIEHGTIFVQNTNTEKEGAKNG